MKQSIYLITALSLAASSTAFTTPHTFISATTSSHTTTTTALSMAELTPEPEGGDELSQLDNVLENSRMKNMGKPPADGTVAAMVDGSEVYSFWLTAEAEGSFVQQIRTKLLKEAGKNANFPGFRKVSGC